MGWIGNFPLNILIIIPPLRDKTKNKVGKGSILTEKPVSEKEGIVEFFFKGTGNPTGDF